MAEEEDVAQRLARVLVVNETVDEGLAADTVKTGLPVTEGEEEAEAERVERVLAVLPLLVALADMVKDPVLRLEPVAGEEKESEAEEEREGEPEDVSVPTLEGEPFGVRLEDGEEETESAGEEEAVEELLPRLE